MYATRQQSCYSVAIAAVRDVSTLSKVHGSKTVRDFRKPLFGFGQHLLLALEQGKKQDDGPWLSEAFLDLIRAAIDAVLFL